MARGNAQLAPLDLAPFCADEEQHPTIAQPWTQGGFTYATDVRMVVRVPAREGEVEVEHPLTASVEQMFADHAPPPSAQFTRLPPLEGTVGQPIPCSECHGSGAVLNRKRKPVLCPECGGLQQLADRTPVAVGERWFSADCLYLMAALPRLRVIARGKFPKPLVFVFDGGKGLLMPRAHTPAD